MRLHRSFAGLLVSLIFHIGSPSSHTNTLFSFESLWPQSNRTLVSPGDVFELGFFSRGTSAIGIRT
ncbi:hypothetical protein ARALYDRAFT_899216 [Arabidopsis lyrata subsp. lyrata]|uniref:Secreted protein n=1 Tax=Arabidopsis lyrata subsp. lyrata TaxID=81972 RepID=D7L7F5_ARALL|nr:hypothetical protein ARALYDRAFT_899216 [Arabidopsis lyrata subsp. lyrata]